MQRCVRCRIDIRGNKKCCPLCGGKLSGTPEEEPFPRIPRRRVSSWMVIKMATFVFVIYEAVMVTITATMQRFLPWMPLAMIAGFAVLMDIIFLIYYRHNVLKVVISQIYIGMIVSFIVDKYALFYGWSVIWVLPSCFIAADISIIAIGTSLKYHPRDVILYLLLNYILNLVQVFFIRHGMNPFPLPAYISIAFSTVVMAGVLIFRGRMFRDMTERFFNV